MNLFNKQGFWVTLASTSLAIFTTFNTYQLQKSNQISQVTQQQIVALQNNLQELNSRIDNLYDIIFEIKKERSSKN